MAKEKNVDPRMKKAIDAYKKVEGAVNRDAPRELGEVEAELPKPKDNPKKKKADRRTVTMPQSLMTPSSGGKTDAIQATSASTGSRQNPWQWGPNVYEIKKKDEVGDEDFKVELKKQVDKKKRSEDK